jgi:hypothetical protein
MMIKHSLLFLVSFSLAILLSSCESNKDASEQTSSKNESGDPLPSWNDVTSKNNIIAYVTDVTNAKSENFIPIEDRIATFDNDGNLWAEQPAYFQLFFAIDRVKAMAADHPEWKDVQPFKAVLDNDMDELKKQGEHGLIQLVMATHAGSTVEEFDADVKDWIAHGKTPYQKNKL